MTTNLAELIAPISNSTFFERYYEQDVLYVANRGFKSIKGICTRDDIEVILGQHKDTIHEFIRLGKKELILFPKLMGRSTSTYQWVLRQYHEGWTVIVDYLQKLSLPVGRLRQGLESDFGCTFDISAFLTPKYAPGLDPHCDRTDVFILQIEGSKIWRLFGKAGPYLMVDLENLGNPEHEIVLQPGDVLYLPRGYIHQAQTEEQASLSLSIKPVNPFRLADLLKELLEIVAETEGELGRAIPLHQRQSITQEHIEGALSALVRHINNSDSFNRTLTRLKREVAASTNRYSHPHGVLDEIEATDLVKRAFHTSGRLEHNQELETISLHFPHGAVEHLPQRLEPVLRFIMQATGPFMLADFPGAFSEKTKGTILKRLLQEGFLKKVDTMQTRVNGIEK